MSYIAKLPVSVFGSQEIVSSEMTQLQDLPFVSEKKCSSVILSKKTNERSE
jgi:hypothetical protein